MSERKTRKKLYWKLCFWFFIPIIALILIIVASLPSIISTEWGNNFILTRVNQRITGNLTIKKFSISWFDGFELNELKLYDFSEKEIFYLKSIKGTTTLWNYLSGSSNYGEIKIKGVNIHLKAPETNKVEIESLLSLIKEKQFNKAALLLSTITPATSNYITTLLSTNIDLSLNDATLKFSANEMNPVIFDSITSQLLLKTKKGPLSFSLNSDVIQGNNSGIINVNASLKNIDNKKVLKLWKNRNNSLNIPENASFGASILIENISTNAIEELLKFTSSPPSQIIQEALGPTLNLRLQIDSSPKKGFLNASITTQKLNFQIEANIKDTKFNLTQPSQGTWNLSSSFFNTLSKNYLPKGLLIIDKPTTLNLSITKLQLPFYFIAPNFSKINFLAQCQVNDNVIDFPQTKQTLAISPITLNISTSPNSRQLNFQAEGKTLYNGLQTLINLQSSIKNIFTPTGFTNQNKLSWNSDLSIKNIPSDLIEKFTGLPHLFSQAIGPLFSLDINSQYLDDQKNISLSFESNQIKGTRIPFSLTETLILTEDSTLHFTYPPKVIYSFFPNNTHLEFRDSVKGTLSLKNLLINLNKLSPKTFDPKNTQFNALLQFAPIYLKKIPYLDKKENDPIIKNLEVSIKGKNLSESTLELQGTIYETEKNHPLDIITGSPLSIKINTETQLPNINLFSIPKINLTVESPKLKISLKGNLNEKQKLTFSSPSSITYTLSPKLLEHYQWIKTNLPTLSEPITLSSQITLNSFPIITPSKKDLKGTLNISTSKIKLQNNEKPVSGQLNDFNLNLSFDGPQNSFSKKIKTSIFLASQATSSSFNSSLTFQDFLLNDDWNFEKISLTGSLKASNLPVIFIEGITNQRGKLTHLLGQELNFETLLKVPSIPQQLGIINLDLQAERLRILGKLDVKGNNIHLYNNEPLSIKGNLTPQGYNVLLDWIQQPSEKETVLLSDPASIKLSLAKLSLNLSKPINEFLNFPPGECINITNSSFDATLSIPILSLFNTENKEKIVFDNLTSELYASPLGEKTKFMISSQLKESSKPQNKINELNTINIAGELLNAYPENTKSLNWKGLSTHVSGELKEFPIDTLNKFLPLSKALKGKISAILGSNLSSSLNIKIDKLSGPFNIAVDSQHIKTKISGSLKKGVLHLNDKLLGEVTVNKLFSQEILTNLSPLLSEAVSSTFPITLEVNNEKFSIPLFPTDKNKINVENITVMVGKITLENKGFINKLIKLFDKNPDKYGDQVDAWFTPFKGNIHNGKMTIERTDALIANKFHIASWGTIDFKKEQMNLTIGISSSTLAEFFGLRGLSENYMFLIPISGPIGKVNVEWANIISRLTILSTTQVAPGGSLLGELLTSILGGQSSVPPPPKLPWSKEQINTTNKADDIRDVYSNPLNIFNK